MDRRPRYTTGAKRHLLSRSAGGTDQLLRTRLQWLRLGGVSQRGRVLVCAGADDSGEKVAQAFHGYSSTSPVSGSTDHCALFLFTIPCQTHRRLAAARVKSSSAGMRIVRAGKVQAPRTPVAFQRRQTPTSRRQSRSRPGIAFAAAQIFRVSCGHYAWEIRSRNHASGHVQCYAFGNAPGTPKKNHSSPAAALALGRMTCPSIGAASSPLAPRAIASPAAMRSKCCHGLTKAESASL